MFKKLVNNKTMFFLVIGLLIKVMLDISYAFLFVRGAAGDPTYQFILNPVKLIISYVCCIVLLFFIPKREDSPSFFVQLILILIIIPLSTIYAMKDESSLYFITVVFSYLFVELITPFIVSIKIKEIKNLNIILVIALILFSITTLFIMFSIFNMPSTAAFNFKNVYIIRGGQSINKYVRYLLSCTIRVIIPFLITRAFMLKRYKQCGFWSLVVIYLYLCTANKAYLFMLPLLFTCLIVLRMKNEKYLLFTLLALGLLSCMILQGINMSLGLKMSILNMPFSLIIRRVLLLPAIIKNYYYEFFQYNPTIGLAGTIFTIFFKVNNVYEDVPFAKLVGEQYFNNIQTHANTGMYGSEMARFGIAGIPIASIFFIVLLIACKSSDKNNGSYFTICVVVYIIQMLTDANVVTIMLDLNSIVMFSILLLYRTEKRIRFFSYKEFIRNITRRCNNNPIQKILDDG